MTVYRNPDRPPGDRPNLQWLNGFALVSEVRRVQLPAGEADIRFEGVAGGILPQSAIIRGLPEQVVEKNRDAYLLSPGTLIEQALGRRVHLRRTDRATGAVREQEAVVRSGSDGALVLQTAAGFEALRCTGLNETIVYDRVPPGLSPKPTLSVRARSSRPVEATVTLSYLATGFDWQANYVAQLNSAGDRMDLLAWLTLANGDETGFREASTQAVAGRLQYERAQVPRPEARAINLNCWPGGTTSDIPMHRLATFDAAEAIVVTGSRIAVQAPPPPPPPPMPERGGMEASQEELGDLKLYRIPEPVTVAARGQKQVRFLERRQVPVRFVYRKGHSGETLLPTRRVLIFDNKAAAKLGIPLPAGQLVLFADRQGERLLLGEGATGDKAVGEEVEIDLGPAPGVLVEWRATGQTTAEIIATNDGPRPILLEYELSENARPATRIGRRNGRPLWRVTVPANGTRTLRVTVG